MFAKGRQREREREGDSECVSARVWLCSPTCICTQVAFVAAVAVAVANKFVKLHSQFAVFHLSLVLSLSHSATGVTSAATNKKTPQYVSWSPQSTTARPLLPSHVLYSFLLFRLLCVRYAPVYHSDSFYTFHFIVTYAFISQFRSFSLW